MVGRAGAVGTGHGRPHQGFGRRGRLACRERVLNRIGAGEPAGGSGRYPSHGGGRLAPAQDHGHMPSLVGLHHHGAAACVGHLLGAEGGGPLSPRPLRGAHYRVPQVLRGLDSVGGGCPAVWVRSRSAPGHDRQLQVRHRRLEFGWIVGCGGEVGAADDGARCPQGL